MPFQWYLKWEIKFVEYSAFNVMMIFSFQYDFIVGNVGWRWKVSNRLYFQQRILWSGWRWVIQLKDLPFTEKCTYVVRWCSSCCSLILVMLFVDTRHVVRWYSLFESKYYCFWSKFTMIYHSSKLISEKLSPHLKKMRHMQ